MQSITKIKQFILRYRHAWVLLYSFIYMPWFCYLEKHRFSHYYLIHSPLDDYIPFVEYFIVPYLLWFLFIAVTIAYFFFTDKKGYYQLTAFLFTGMTIFLIICTVFPNELNLRPHTFANDTVFTRLVQQLYSTDTPTNVLPSIHVYNSLGAHFAVMNNETLSGKKWVRRGSMILCVSIILSTMFIKQHSMFDVLMAFIMGAVMYAAVYYYDVVGAYRFQTGKRQRKRARIG